MPFHITVLPASTQAGKETIRILLESDIRPLVRGIYRDVSKAPSEFKKNPRFEAVSGDVGTGTSLDFTQSDAVLYIPPPTYDGKDQAEWANRTAMSVAKALSQAPNVKRLVLHSALGAQHSHGTGILRLNHISDSILKTAAPEVIIVRPCYYFQTFCADAAKTMQTDPPKFESWVSPDDFRIPLVSIKDIGAYCAKTLLDQSAKSKLQNVKLFGPRLYHSLDVKMAIEALTGKPGELITVPREGLAEYWAKSLPKEHVQDFVDFTTSQLAGGVLAEEYGYDERTVRCERELIDDLREMISK